uniref:Uncharacterized protein n=1 Tax=Stegastes partitus TaxID=144197 RepID=A0A3B5BCI1_9TELE
MIQSSQPISLKLTWSRRRFLAPLDTVLLSWSRFLLRPNARKKAFSLLVLPRREKPSERRSAWRPPRSSTASSSRHSCCSGGCLEALNSFQTSNTSHRLPKPCTSSSVLVCSSVGFCLPEQVSSFRWAEPPSALRGSDTRFLRIRSSAPSSPSRPRSSERRHEHQRVRKHDDTQTHTNTRGLNHAAGLTDPGFLCVSRLDVN